MSSGVLCRLSFFLSSIASLHPFPYMHCFSKQPVTDGHRQSELNRVWWWQMRLYKHKCWSSLIEDGTGQDWSVETFPSPFALQWGWCYIWKTGLKTDGTHTSSTLGTDSVCRVFPLQELHGSTFWRLVLGVAKDIIDPDDDAEVMKTLLEYLIHEALEHGGRVGQAIRHYRSL